MTYTIQMSVSRLFGAVSVFRGISIFSTACLSRSLAQAAPRAAWFSSRSVESTTANQTSTPAQSKAQSRLIYPDPPSIAHNDLSSYTAYAFRTGLDPSSTTYTGTHYEYTVAASLGRLGFDLRRVGGRSDGGIDLLGTWAVPSVATPVDGHAPPPLRIILQCKAFGPKQSSKVGPQHVRELEGAFVAAPPGWRGGSTGKQGVVGVLVTQKPATKGVRDSLTRSRWPMAYMSCTKDGRVEQLLWNRQAEEQGLAGMGVAVQHSEGQAGEKVEELVLTWQGLPYTASDTGTGVP
ncbi:hypothetical protein Micbo1qcDRAFT_168694 [Microdochium bolleyi]|uniref:Restriction endonuclease type IV Mrr domain-containing protein n=1 Tax=Microdochium bolleyi TaxID=196109 RepID=A0A136IMH0_9PEZI|nr:hypothetical protein Micbo1qcDRAFT_168694 [Microdochium bolleyi]